jgi:hypothetical protein
MSSGWIDEAVAARAIYTFQYWAPVGTVPVRVSSIDPGLDAVDHSSRDLSILMVVMLESETAVSPTAPE